MSRFFSAVLLFSLLAIPASCYSEVFRNYDDNVSKAYIVTSSDTLEVFIKDQLSYNYSIQYKEDLNSKDFLSMQSKEIILLISNQIEYQRIFNGSKSILAKVLRKGSATLLEHTEISYSTHHVYDNKTGSFLPTKGYEEATKYYLKKNSKTYYVGDFISFKRRLKNVLNDKPEIHELINSMRYRFLEYELEQVIRRYNQISL